MTFEQGATRRLHKKLKSYHTSWYDFYDDRLSIDVFHEALNKGHEVAFIDEIAIGSGCCELCWSCEPAIVYTLDNGLKLTELDIDEEQLLEECAND